MVAPYKFHPIYFEDGCDDTTLYSVSPSVWPNLLGFLKVETVCLFQPCLSSYIHSQSGIMFYLDYNYVVILVTTLPSDLISYKRIHMCTVISKGCNCRYSEILVYKHVKMIILEIRLSLLSPRSRYMPTQLIWSYFMVLLFWSNLTCLYPCIMLCRQLHHFDMTVHIFSNLSNATHANLYS